MAEQPTKISLVSKTRVSIEFVDSQSAVTVQESANMLIEELESQQAEILAVDISHVTFDRMVDRFMIVVTFRYSVVEAT